MKIAIEAQRIFRRNKHGMDFVALETIRELQLMDLVNEYYILVAPGDDRCLESTKNVRIVEVKCPTYPLWEQLALPNALRRIKPHLLHCTSNTAPIHCNVPLVLTLHDIIFLEQRTGKSASWYQNFGWHYRRFVVPRVLPDCRRIITVSNFERGRIGEALNLPAERLVAIYNGFSSHFRPVADHREVTRKYIDHDDYLFFLGNTDPKKNTPRILKAYELYTSMVDEPLPLLIADLSEGVIDGILREQGITQIKHRLRFPGYIPNTDLPAVYSGARVFLYASLRESFGIPILESMACGTPIVTSDTSAMPEIAGTGAMLVDPTDAAAIARAVADLQNDPALYARQRDYGLQRVKQFSWKKTATKLLKLYEEVYTETKPHAKRTRK